MKANEANVLRQQTELFNCPGAGNSSGTAELPRTGVADEQELHTLSPGQEASKAALVAFLTAVIRS